MSKEKNKIYYVVSFLGMGPYSEVNYTVEYGDKKTCKSNYNAKYTSIALMKYAFDKYESDNINSLIFTTYEAIKRDSENCDSNNLTNDGRYCKEVFAMSEELNKKFNVIDIPIEAYKGDTETHISWYKKIVELYKNNKIELHENVTFIIDTTHGMKIQPQIAITLFNFLSEVYGCKIDGIYYAPYNKTSSPDEVNESVFTELTETLNFDDVQRAINLFESTNESILLNELIKNRNYKFNRKFKELLGTHISNFSENVKLCNIEKAEEAVNSIKAITNEEITYSDYDYQKKIIDKINEIFSDLIESVDNQFKFTANLLEYYIKRRMYIQALTLSNEKIVEVIVELADLRNIYIRNKTFTDKVLKGELNYNINKTTRYLLTKYKGDKFCVKISKLITTEFNQKSDGEKKSAYKEFGDFLDSFLIDQKNRNHNLNNTELKQPISIQETKFFIDKVGKLLGENGIDQIKNLSKSLQEKRNSLNHANIDGSYSGKIGELDDLIRNVIEIIDKVG